jgi:hypothetical protein
VPSSIYTKLGAAFAALAAGAAAVTIAAQVLNSTLGTPVASPSSTVPAQGGSSGGTTTTSSPRPPRAPSAFPAPPTGATVFSREEGDDVVALGIVSTGRRALLQVSILNGQGHGATGRVVRVALGSRTVAAAPCGPGCYRVSVAAPSRPKAAVVVVGRGSGATVWRISLPAHWPSPSAAGLIRQAGAAWRALTSLAYHDHLASDPTHAVASDWRVAAPDKASYVTSAGTAGIVIGGERWDRSGAHAAWVKSAQTLTIHQPVPFWTSATDAHVLRHTTVNGRAADVVSFFDPGTPAWFEVTVETGTKHTVELFMNTTAHFMHDTYSAFDSAASIMPPK